MAKEKTKEELEDEVAELKKENASLKKKITAKEAYAKSQKEHAPIVSSKAVQH